MTVKHRVEREGERETQPRGERRRVPLTVAFASGFITCVVLCLQYYSKGGCSAAREIGRRENARQVSDLMCCPVGKLIGTCQCPKKLSSSSKGKKTLFTQAVSDYA